MLVDAVPASAVRRILEDWLLKNPPQTAGPTSRGDPAPTTPSGQVSWAVYGQKDTGFIVGILNGKVQSMNFDVADKFFCRLGVVEVWQTDPELSEIYKNVNLRVLDLKSPTTERQSAIADRYFRLLLSCLPQYKVAEIVGMDIRSIMRRVAA